MHFLKHNETLESCSMVALNRLLKVSESFHGGILAIQDSNGTGPISQVFQSQLCDFLGEFGSKSISGPMGFSPWPPDTEICKGTFVHPPDQRYPGVKIRITEAMLDGALYAFFGEHLNS